MTDKPEVTQADETLADDVIDEITSRKGLRHEFDNIDEEIQAEIRQAFAEIAARHRTSQSESDAVRELVGLLSEWLAWGNSSTDRPYSLANDTAAALTRYRGEV